MRYTSFYLVFLILISNLVANAQKISKLTALGDLRFFNEALKNGHGVNYLADSSININELVKALEAKQVDSLGVVEYYLLLCKAIQQSECMHTNIEKAPFLEKLGTKTYFPLATMAIEDKLFAVNQPDTNYAYLTGKRLESINNISADSLLKSTQLIRADDGNTGSFAKAYGNLAMSSIIGFLCGRPDSFSIQFSDTTLTLPASQKFVANPEEKDTVPKSISWDDNYLRWMNNQTAYLKLNHFDPSFLDKIPEVFDSILNNNISSLIIDLRNNPGGKRTSGVILAQFLVDTTFGYTILQPNLHPYYYLATSGKIAFVFSKLMYNVGDFQKGTKTSLGRSFTYQYQPVPKQKQFRGEVYVLTNGITGSTSTMVTTWLHMHTSTTFIGSQSGGGYNGNNGGSFPSIVLPYSKTKIRFPIYRLVLNDNSTNTGGLEPDYLISKTLESELSQQDLALDKALELIEQKKGTP